MWLLPILHPCTHHKPSMDSKAMFGVLLTLLVVSQIYQIFFLDHRRDHGGVGHPHVARPPPVAPPETADASRAHRRITSVVNNVTNMIFNSSDMLRATQLLGRRIRDLDRRTLAQQQWWHGRRRTTRRQVPSNVDIDVQSRSSVDEREQQPEEDLGCAAGIWDLSLIHI